MPAKKRKKEAVLKSDFDFSYLTLRTSAPRVSGMSRSNRKAEDSGSFFFSAVVD